MEMHYEKQKTSLLKQNIVIYPSHKSLYILAFLIICSILIIVPLIIVLWSISSSSIFSSLKGIPFAGIFFLFTCMILLFWQFWRLLKVLFRPRPALVINSEGIQMYAMPGSGNFFISWREIDTIYVQYYGIFRYINIRPKEIEQYFARFNVLKQLIIHLYMGTALAPINVGLIYLDVPVAVIFRQLSRYYVDELNDNQIKILL